jgi:hypothetical protein
LCKIEKLEEEVRILRAGMLSQVEKRLMKRLPQSSQLRNIRARHLKTLRLEIARLCINCRSTCMLIVWTAKLEGWRRPHLSTYGLGALERYLLMLSVSCILLSAGCPTQQRWRIWQWR